MPALSQRRILSVGGSKAVALPPAWLAALGLDIGDDVIILYDSIVMIKPKGLKVSREFLLKEFALLDKKAL